MYQDESDKELWELYPHVWKTKSAFFTWMRGCLRRAVWERYPIKIEFKNEHCKPPPEDYTGRAKSGEYCSLSGEWTGKSAAEIDHIVGNVSLNDYSDIEDFVRHMCTKKSNMAFVSKPAHKIKSYSEKMGISYEEAVIQKEVIAICKEKADFQDKFIKLNNGNPCKNSKERRTEITNIIRNSIKLEDTHE